MSKEIERKFKIINDSYIAMARKCHNIRQAYLNRDPRSTVRVRIKDDHAFLTIKGLTCGCERDEWEYAIPMVDANEMINKCAGGIVIDKQRFIVEYDGFTWEIDVFHGCHEGLAIAEIELPSPETELKLPPFVGEEVTGDPRYYNSSLASCADNP